MRRRSVGLVNDASLCYVAGSICVAGAVGNLSTPAHGWLTFGLSLVALGIVLALASAKAFE